MPPTTAAQDAEALARINDLLARIEQKTTELVNKINDWLGRLPGFLTGGIREATDRFVNLMNQAYNKLAEILSYMGSPFTLWDTADGWSNQVGAPVSAIAGNADPRQSPVLQTWRGDAASAYEDVLGPQKDALAAIKTVLTDGISTALSKVAVAIVVFWGALAVGLAALVAAIIGALASTATIVGLPAGPIIAAGGVLAFLAALGAGILNLRAQCSDANSLLTQKVADNTAFRQGSWPTSTAELSDGSLSDGDPTDWRLEE